MLDDATVEKQPVRCVIPSVDALLATDPLEWTPYPGEAGLYFPKKGDYALVAKPTDGPSVIVTWHPTAAEPDVP